MQTNADRRSNIEAFKGLKDVFLRRNKNISENIFRGINIRELRATLILFVSILLFLLIFVPMSIVLLIFKLKAGIMSLASLLSIYLMFQLNSLLNPFLNVRTIKDADLLLLEWIKCKWIA